MADYFPKYRIGKWLRGNPRQAHGYVFICPDCEKKSYFLGKGEKKIGRYCTWCGAENNKDGEAGMMVEYIEREAFLSDKKWLYCTDCDKRKGKKRGKMMMLYEIGEAPCKSCGIHDMLEEVEDYPAADVKPVVRGKWTDHRTIEHDGEWYCTACGKEITIYMGADRKDRYAFCPNCGADMREESNERT